MKNKHYITRSSLLLLLGLQATLLWSKPPTGLYKTETYKNRMEQFREEGLKEKQIVFFGNSLTQHGEWATWFPEQSLANRGISGDNTEGMLARLGEVTKAKPAKIFLMAGINDISQNYKNSYIYRNFEKIIRQIKSESPETKIYIQSLLPINNHFGRYKKLINKEKQIEQLNRRLKSLCKKEKIGFINLYPLFLQKRRELNSLYTGDGLHLNEAGYQIWTNAIKNSVTEQVNN